MQLCWCSMYRVQGTGHRRVLCTDRHTKCLCNVHQAIGKEASVSGAANIPSGHTWFWESSVYRLTVWLDSWMCCSWCTNNNNKNNINQQHVSRNFSTQWAINPGGQWPRHSQYKQNARPKQSTQNKQNNQQTLVYKQAFNKKASNKQCFIKVGSGMPGTWRALPRSCLVVVVMAALCMMHNVHWTWFDMIGSLQHRQQLTWKFKSHTLDDKWTAHWPVEARQAVCEDMPHVWLTITGCVMCDGPIYSLTYQIYSN